LHSIADDVLLGKEPDEDEEEDEGDDKEEGADEESGNGCSE